MLLAIRSYIKQEKIVGQTQIARYFQVDQQALQPMLDILIRKKVIQVVDGLDGCQKSCQSCPVNLEKYYQILE